MERKAQLWTVTLISPGVWFFSMLANFALAPWSCSWAWRVALFLVSALSLAIAAGAGLLSWTRWRAASPEQPGVDGRAANQSRILALAGVGLSAMFFLVIVAQALPNLMLKGCR